MDASDLWQIAKRSARGLLGMVRQVLVPTYSIELHEPDETRLVLVSGGREVVINKRFRTIKCRGDVLARFDEIQSIELRCQSDDDGPAYWIVRLRISWLSSVQVGRTSDRVEASIVGARLSTFTGKRVVA
jgi:hypothetical protein